ncbi:FG-GAP repeat domain-containing protein [Streptomyces sp. NPDC048350]|uniref:FG-GAP repeat domain-containing protein n=1 Tax=Streptomyces sp. NPDC048350 TaxID=3365538 RepID=UPI0037103E78
MFSVRAPRRRVAGAVATVLAVTLGAGVLTVPAAVAAPSAAVLATAEAQDSLAQMPFNSQVLSAGASGFFSANEGTGRPVYWTSYIDGKTARVEGYANPAGGDLYFDYARAVVVNMATGATFTLPAGHTTKVGIAGQAVFTTPTPQTLWTHTAQGSRQVTGLPAGAKNFSVRAGDRTHGLVGFTDADGVGRLALVELATAEMTETLTPPEAASGTDYSLAALSGTHAAWARHDTATGTTRVVVRDRATGKEKTVDLGPAKSLPSLGLVGDWLVHGLDSTHATEPSPMHSLRALNLASEAGETVTLLDHFQTMAPEAAGGLLVSGGLLGSGDGAYRIAQGQDGKPAATFVASAGSPTETAETSPAKVPSGTIDLDKGGDVDFTWYFNRRNTKTDFTLRHVRTGLTYRHTQDVFEEAGEDGFHPYGFAMGPAWWGEKLDITHPDGSAAGITAYNGAYTWEMTAESAIGVGPALKRSGTFTLARSPKMHDFDDNGSTDLLARDASGTLWSDTTYAVARNTDEKELPEAEIGGGWQIYDRIETTGNIAGSPASDVVARDRSGVLWLYQGNGNGGFAGRVKVGGGWQTYDKLTGGSDFTGDGRPDLLAADKTGTLYLYASTGHTNAPFSARRKIGTGWGVYNQLTAVGNIAGAGAGDLVARDKDGVLWLYLGKGDGTFTARTRIGAGWNRYSELIGSGDYNGDGRNDLIAYEPATRTAYYFKGTGDRSTPFEAKRAGTDLFSGGSYNQLG